MLISLGILICLVNRKLCGCVIFDRYIQRAGEAGCFFSKYPSVVRQAELKWAEKGPRRSGERGFGRSGMVSTAKSPVAPTTPSGAHSTSGLNSFVMTPSYSPYTPTHHHYPF